MVSPRCPICMVKYNAKTVRPHIIVGCLHAMCLECCRKSGRCGTCNSTYNKTDEFKISTDLETLHREIRALRRVKNKDVDLTAQQLEEMFVRDDVRTSTTRAPNSEFRIFVRNYAGKSVPIDVKSDQTVAMLKQAINVANHTPVEEQLLLFGGRELADDKTLGFYKLSRGYTIQLTARQIGGIGETCVSN